MTGRTGARPGHAPCKRGDLTGKLRSPQEPQKHEKVGGPTTKRNREATSPEGWKKEGELGKEMQEHVFKGIDAGLSPSRRKCFPDPLFTLFKNTHLMQITFLSSLPLNLLVSTAQPQDCLPQGAPWGARPGAARGRRSGSFAPLRDHLGPHYRGCGVRCLRLKVTSTFLLPPVALFKIMTTASLSQRSPCRRTALGGSARQR